MSKSNEYQIITGEVKRFNVGYLGLKILYSGMPNEQTFSLTLFTNDGGHCYSPTIYYDIKSKLIRVLEYNFKVIRVSREGIVLQASQSSKK